MNTPTAYFLLLLAFELSSMSSVFVYEIIGFNLFLFFQ